MTIDNILIGEKLKALRTEKRLKQVELATKIGMTQQNYSRYERGESMMPYNDLVNISMFYNIPITYFLGIELAEETPNETRLLQYFRMIPDYFQPHVINSIKSLATGFSKDKKIG